MEWKIDESRLYREMEPVIRGLGYSLVEFTHKNTKYNLQVHAVIYTPGGVSLDDCERVHKTIMPRIELIEDTEEIHLEVSSPGITRNLKNAAEFAVFIGEYAAVLPEGESQWLYGTIKEASSDGITVHTAEGDRTLKPGDIRKAKLAVSQEEKERS
jgi:ribosome maturation factor RimP